MSTNENKQGNGQVVDSDSTDFLEFNRKSFGLNCQTASKFQSMCNENITKLVAECERLNAIAKKKSAILAIKSAEMERMNLDKKKSAENANSTTAQQLYALQQDVKSKEVEIQYLEAQLKKKEDENANLKKETEKMLLEQQIKFSQSIVSQKPSVSPDKRSPDKRRATLTYGLPHDEPEKSAEFMQAQITELTQKVEFYKAKAKANEDPQQLLPVIYEAYNNDLKGRLKFIDTIHKWQRLGDKVSGRAPHFHQESFKDFKLQDGDMAHEHFHSTKSQLATVMENAYFPVIDCHEHDNHFEKLDVAIKMEHDKLQDKILVELVTLQQVMDAFGLIDDDDGTKAFDPKRKFAEENKIGDSQKFIIGGLMKRLLNQLPAKIPNTEIRSDDFQVKISNLYLMLQKRVSMKKIFEVSMDVSMRKTYEDINQMTEKIMALILDYDEFCEAQEAKAVQPKVSTQNVFNHFAARIQDKMQTIKRKNSGTGPLDANDLRGLLGGAAFKSPADRLKNKQSDVKSARY